MRKADKHLKFNIIYRINLRDVFLKVQVLINMGYKLRERKLKTLTRNCRDHKRDRHTQTHGN